MRRILIGVVVLVLSAAALMPAVFADECPSGHICVEVNTTLTRGAATHRAQGFTSGISAGTNQSLVGELEPSHWRVAGVDEYNQALAHGGTITFVISEAWRRATFAPANGGDGSLAAWLDFPAYDAFVTGLVSAYPEVDYWDVFDEPGTDRFPPPEGPKAATLTEVYLEIFRHAHDAIRAVKPAAKLVGPTLDVFRTDYMPATQDARFRWPDLTTFLDYVVLTGLKVDAISWHEKQSVDPAVDHNVTPRTLTQHVTKARQLLALRPTVGTPEIHITYGAVATGQSPGWGVGWISQIEQGNVDVGARDCWRLQDAAGRYDGCKDVMSGLFERDASTPRPAYWTHRRYAEMDGTRATTTTSDAISGFATIAADQSIRILLGRHRSCRLEANLACGSIASPPIPRNADTEVRVLSSRPGAVIATLERIPDQADGLSAPIEVWTQTLTPSGGGFDISIPSFADGDAYVLTLVPVPTLAKLKGGLR